MTSVMLRFGSQIASDIRNSSQTFSQAPQAPTTLGDVLDILGKNPPSELPTLKTTSSRLADFLELRIDQITIDSVNEARDGFRAFLKGRKYKENAIRTYVNHARILIRRAAEFGWLPSAVVPVEWQGVLTLAANKNCKDLAHHLLRLRKRPSDVTVERCGRLDSTKAWPRPFLFQCKRQKEAILAPASRLRQHRANSKMSPARKELRSSPRPIPVGYEKRSTWSH